VSEDILQWLLAWFQRRGPLPEGSGFTSENYFELGLLESLDVIDLIADVEDRYGIQFESQHFEDRRFSTLAGLAELIRELADAAH